MPDGFRPNGKPEYMPERIYGETSASDTTCADSANTMAKRRILGETARDAARIATIPYMSGIADWRTIAYLTAQKTNGDATANTANAPFPPPLPAHRKRTAATIAKGNASSSHDLPAVM